jgi:beta-glucosidase
VLLFVHDPVASVSRPVLELKGMAKTVLAPGERATVRISLAVNELTFLGSDMKPRLEPGRFDLFVGPSAQKETLLKTSVTLLPS